MSSSANRRRRVAGERRRPGSTPPPATPSAQGTPPDHTPEDADHDDAPNDVDTAIDGDAPKGGDADGGGASSEVETAHHDASEGDTAPDDENHPGDSPARGRRGSSRRAMIVAATALAVSLIALAAVLAVTWKDPAERSRSATAATAAARGSLEQILSYNYASMDKQVPTSQALMTGSFKNEFGTTMTKTIIPLSKKNKTVVKARVYDTGVMSQTDTSVKVQAFVNQASTSAAQKTPAIDQNRVIATMTRVGNRWLISDLKAY